MENNVKVVIPGKDNPLEEVAKAAKQLDDLSIKDQLDQANKQIEVLTQAVADRDKAIREYQDINQRLFLRVANPVDTGNTQPGSTDPLVQSALDKIKEYNERITNDGSNN